MRPPFVCPVCGHDEFQVAVLRNLKPTDSYECQNCSVVFRDPASFSTARQDLSTRRHALEAIRLAGYRGSAKKKDSEQ